MGISDRLRQVVEHSGKNAKAFAESVGVPYSTLHNYLKYDRDPAASVVGQIITQTGIDANWLLTGEGAMQRTQTDVCNIPLDEGLLSDIIEVLEGMCVEYGVALPARKKAEAILLLYDYFQDDGKVERNTVARVLRLVA